MVAGEVVDRIRDVLAAQFVDDVRCLYLGADEREWCGALFVLAGREFDWRFPDLAAFCAHAREELPTIRAALAASGRVADAGDGRH